MVTHKKLVSVYLPEELYQALIAYQEQREFAEASLAVADILAQFFHETVVVKRYATVEQLEALESIVACLSEQVSQLKQSSRLAPTQKATTASTADNTDIPVQHPAQSPVSAFANTDFDQVDDEPYEILHDFLEPEK